MQLAVMCLLKTVFTGSVSLSTRCPSIGADVDLDADFVYGKQLRLKKVYLIIVCRKQDTVSFCR